MDIEELYSRFTECNGLTTDSRHCPEGSMFLALKGETFNGNAFAAQSLTQGCRYAVVDEPQYASPENPRILLVENCLQTLQQLANYHRRKLGTRMVGVTGTNGKTTTKELIAAVLKEKFNVLYTQGNFNNHIGVPLTLLRLKPNMRWLSLKWEPIIRVKSRRWFILLSLIAVSLPMWERRIWKDSALLKESSAPKENCMTIFEKGNATIFIQNENPHLNKIAEGLNCVRYGQTSGLDVSGTVLSCSPFLHLGWTAGGASHEVKTHLIGAYNLDNALAAVAIGRYFGVEDTQICHALSSYVPQNNRSQLVQTESNTLIVDAYNANPTSMMAALVNFRQMEAEHKVAILGAMKELGEVSREEHQKVVDFLNECQFERVILVGPSLPGSLLRLNIMRT